MTENSIELRSRFRGALLGLAAGDAVGTTLEFRSPGSFDPISDMTGGGPFSLRPGEWTDDASMALCLAESLVECGGFDERDQMERFVRWWKDGHLSSTGECFDIGTTVRAALARYLGTGEPFAGSTDSNASGNGSLMRLAPVVLAFASKPDEAVARAEDSSRTTHASAQCVDSCRLFARYLLRALSGASKEEIVAPAGLVDPSAPPHRAVAAIADGSFLRRDPPDIRGTGYVVAALEAAMWAFHRGRDFREVVLLAANLGDDADTTSAIAGQIAGAFWGEEGIPVEWREKLAMRGEIESLADGLYAMGSEK
ncbi:MAG: ADP-ribosylglycohydrolase family protein [Thermoanaerobaculia bacterium]